ncbi:sensor histidine kinase [Nitratidesulfovibrio liaohensis]|uniref:Sensor histidine kinase n=1 Tax=Nitratidesulfovibrio liaohensis TaxID=2604158 RepID=A0ABY9QXK4_9BACT|nr:sensor histidine kinase [Nitratidesulfovibrio liaohensis]WMW64037.1 sensor histidine kinase [Nitratidesulfovibrio liaohensis]
MAHDDTIHMADPAATSATPAPPATGATGATGGDDAAHECVGRLAASATHELQNALAVIRESAGLMQDLVSLCGEGLPHRDRLCTMLSLIQEQVARGGDLAWNLNRLAHAWEEDGEAARDLGAVLEEFVALARRGCAMRGVELSQGDGPAVRVNAPGLPLRASLLRAVRCCPGEGLSEGLAGGPAGGMSGESAQSARPATGGALVLRAALHDGVPGVELDFTPPGARAASGATELSTASADIARCMQACGAEVLQAKAAQLHFFLPCPNCTA